MPGVECAMNAQPRHGHSRCNCRTVVWSGRWMSRIIRSGFSSSAHLIPAIRLQTSPFPIVQSRKRPDVLLPDCELSVRIPTAVIGNCVSAPFRMISLPPVKSPKHHSITDNPSPGVPVHILVTVQADIFISIPNITLRGIGHDRHWDWRCHNYWWRIWLKSNSRPIRSVWSHPHKTTR